MDIQNATEPHSFVQQVIVSTFYVLGEELAIQGETRILTVKKL